MTRHDGRTITVDRTSAYDVVIVGSGAGGCAVAREVARSGARTLVIEAGPWPAVVEHPRSAFEAMATQYVGMGASVVVGAAPLPVVQGRRVGGSAAINGAICWRLPRDVHDAWVADDPALADALSWETLEAVTDEVEARLGVAPTPPELSGGKGVLMAQGADALGLEHRPIRRNVRGCKGSGRCLQGCPNGAKASPDMTLLSDAVAAGAEVAHDTEVLSVVHHAGRVVGVTARAAGGGRWDVKAPHVVVAAGAVHTPVLLGASGVRGGPLGHHFQGHPGVSVSGRFPDPVRSWDGATQSHEVIGLRGEGLKFETLGFGDALLAGRIPGVGRALAAEVAALSHHTDWGAAVKARSHGRVRRIGRRPIVTWTASAWDLDRFRQAIDVLGRMMFAAGATHVAPGVQGFDPVVHHPDRLRDLVEAGPRRASAYAAAITHLFGTARLHSDPRRGVVGPDFRHHRVDGLWVADASVFPSNTGVNPQIAIMALATLAGRRVAAAG